MNSVTSPKVNLFTTVPATLAITIGANEWIAKCLRITSDANNAPAMGALKLADTAPATAHPSKSLVVTASTLTRSHIHPEITAAK